MQVAESRAEEEGRDVLCDVTGERAGDDDQDVKEGLIQRAHEALRAGRITRDEYDHAKIIEEKVVQSKRYLLKLLVELENRGMARNAFMMSIGAMTIIMWLYPEFSTEDVYLVSGYFSHPSEEHKYAWPHMWVETKHLYFSKLWKKITGSEEETPESRVIRMTDLSGGTKDLRNAVIMGQGLALDEKSVQLRYYRTKPEGLSFKKGKREACLQAEKNNEFVRSKPAMWRTLLDPRVATLFDEAVKVTMTEDPRQLRLKRSQEEMKHFYESVEAAEEEYQKIRQKHEEQMQAQAQTTSGPSAGV
jgi:hypothetical protein